MGKNGYWTYFQEQKKSIPGWQHKSHQELRVIIDEVNFPMFKSIFHNSHKGWNSMSKEELMRYYNGMSGELDLTRRKGERRIKGGYDTLSRSLAEIKRRDAERAKKEQNKKVWIEKMVKTAKSQGRLEKIKFNVIAVNIFTQTEEVSPVYVPAELSVAQFSLSEGLDDKGVYQVFPDPGKIPLGYTRRCLENSDREHKVPIPGLSKDPEECYGGEEVKFVRTPDKDLCKDLTSFLFKVDNIPLTVFTMPCQVEQVEGVISCL